MTSWMKERDRLVEQTLAFVKGVAAQRPIKANSVEAAALPVAKMPFAEVSVTDEPVRDVSGVATDAPALPIALLPMAQRRFEPVLATEPIASADDLISQPLAAKPLIHQPAAKRPISVLLPERDVITQRVARFRAGQQKLLQDREDNYMAAQTKIRASLGNDPLA